MHRVAELRLTIRSVICVYQEISALANSRRRWTSHIPPARADFRFARLSRKPFYRRARFRRLELLLSWRLNASTCLASALSSFSAA